LLRNRQQETACRLFFFLTLGPLLIGLEKPVQIAPLGAKMSEIHNAALIAAL